MSCLTLLSRSGVPICPRKYFETTILVACCDQNEGISTSRCSNTTSPRSFPMTADRCSQVTSSNGSTPGSVKKRGNSRPGEGAAAGSWRSSTGAASCARAGWLLGWFCQGWLLDTRGVVGCASFHSHPPLIRWNWESCRRSNMRSPPWGCQAQIHHILWQFFRANAIQGGKALFGCIIAELW